MTIDYDRLLQTQLDDMIAQLARHMSEEDLQKVRSAYEFAKQAHAQQVRKTGEPYIMHPLAVARIMAEEFQMGLNPIIAGFLHDVVEDTAYTLQDISAAFGADVAFLVEVVTKKKCAAGDNCKQENNFKQLLESLHYDIRAVMVKLADRLHNMRTLDSMKLEKQMKIAGETDFFYAPFANRLGLHSVRRELENLSLRFRCPDRYERLAQQCQRDKEDHEERLAVFTQKLEKILSQSGLPIRCQVRHRLPYSIYQQMQKTGRAFEHIKYRHIVRLIYDKQQIDEKLSDKDICLRIYSVLTSHFQEKPGSLINYIDHPKENGYQSLHLKVLTDDGRWEELHISSETMVRRTKLGVILDRMEEEESKGDKDTKGKARLEKTERRWLNKFRTMLRELAEGKGEAIFMESISSSLYNEDITVFDSEGQAVQLPQHATAIDFAFETNVGEHAQCARINGRLASLKTTLSHGDCVEIDTHAKATPQADWLKAAKTYKAKNYLKPYIERLPRPVHPRCEVCKPLPGQEVIGFQTSEGSITVHRRDCPKAISLSAQRGDSIVGVDFPVDENIRYAVKTRIRAIDRPHLLTDIINSLSNNLNIPIHYIHAENIDNIVEIILHYEVCSAAELRTAVRFLSVIENVDEVLKI